MEPQRTTAAEFFRRPCVLLEDVFSIEALERESLKDTPHEAARLWALCVKFAADPQMGLLADSELYDIAFCVSLTFAFDQLRAAGRLPRSFVQKLESDKPCFIHLAYEAEMAAYFMGTGYAETKLGEPDIVVPMNASTCFVACKKLASTARGDTYLAAVVRNLDSAVDQIADHGTGLAMVEVDVSGCGIDCIEAHVVNHLDRHPRATAISAVHLTWWERTLHVGEVEGREVRVYAARRCVRSVVRNLGSGAAECPLYEGETIEWIDAPPVLDVRLSNVARSDDWLKLVAANHLEPDKVLCWGPEVQTSL